MNEHTLKALIEAGAIKRIHIIANGSCFFVEVHTLNGPRTASTLTGSIKTWRTLDSTAKWVHKLGIGKTTLDIANWHPDQHSLRVK